jgi:transposase InsO family protein
MPALLGPKPALVARLCADRWAALAHPGGGRRLYPRLPGAGGRHIDLGHPGRARARQDRRCAQSACRIVSDNGTELASTAILAWSDRQKVAWHYITPGKPVENAFIESFNGRLRDELLNEILFRSLPQARVALEIWRRNYNTERPHSGQGRLVQALPRERGARALRSHRAELGHGQQGDRAQRFFGVHNLGSKR